MAQEFGPVWVAWIWVAVVGLSVAAAVAIRLSGRARLATLPLQHAAGAAVVGVVGWGLALQLPNVIQLVVTGYAGIESGAPGQSAYQMLAVMNVVVVVAAAIAVVALPLRYVWAVPLGIGVCLAAIGWSIIVLLSTLSFASRFPDENQQLLWSAVTTSLQVVPPIAGIVFLVWPFVRGAARPMPGELDSSTEVEFEEGAAPDRHDVQLDRSSG